MGIPEFSIILLTKNAGNIFSKVLFNLFNCDYIDKAEVIMVDSGSTDLTKKYAQQYRPIRLVEISPTAFGHGRTRNLGASLAVSDILVFLVQDATPATSDFLTRLLAPLADSRVAAAYGRQLPRVSTNPIEKFFLQATYPDEPQTRRSRFSIRPSIHSIFFSNVCSAIRRQVWKQVPFDENIIMSEDQKWAKEVLNKGFSIIYQPAATVWHSHNYGLKQVFQRNFDSGCSLTGIIGDSFSQMVSYEVNYLWTGIKSLINNGNSAWIFYLFFHEVARTLGYILGKNSQLLPIWLNYHLSMHKYYWKDQV